MSDFCTVSPTGPVTGSIRPPGSKSITNRALVCAALASGRSRLTGTLESEDTGVMIESLGRLGIAVRRESQDDVVTLDGCGGVIPRDSADLFTANSGTTLRFLTAAVTLGRGTYRLDGIERMRQRPVADLLEALNQLGTDARSETGTGCPPVVIRTDGLRGGRAQVRGDISSQFLSGLLMAAPCARETVRIEVEGTLVSRPYVEMTLAVMRAFGAEVESDADLSRFTIPAGVGYRGREYAIEPDASAASYFWGAAAISGGSVLVEGLQPNALQGDVRFCDCLARMGCQVETTPRGIQVTGAEPLRGIDVDMNAISDTVQTLAAVALFAEGPTRIRNVGHIRHKETDRIGDLAVELRKLGATVEETADGLQITPGPLRGAVLDTYNDHRMAMSLALVGLRITGVVINNPGCTEKTYPRYFDDLERLCRGGE